MNPDLEDMQDKINYLEWQLKNKLEEAATLKKRVEGLRETRDVIKRRDAVDSWKPSKLIEMLGDKLEKDAKERSDYLDKILMQRPWAEEEVDG